MSGGFERLYGMREIGCNDGVQSLWMKCFIGWISVPLLDLVTVRLHLPSSPRLPGKSYLGSRAS